MGTFVDRLAAGAAAAMAKNAVTTWIYEHEDPDARRREDAARNDTFAYEVAAGKGAQLLHVRLDDRQTARAGQALHWSLGIGSVLLYAYLRKRSPRLRALHGLAFGVPFTWLVLDEFANPILGLSPPPKRFPWQTHARALAGHVVLWITAETLLRRLDSRDDP